MDSSPILVCFALREEAKFFSAAKVGNNCAQLITGMGPKNAGDGIRAALSRAVPGLVVTAGFAGGLNLELKIGDIVYEEDATAGLGERLKALGAIPGKFHCAERVIVAAAEKRALRQATGADAVEMESAVIRAVCRERNIPSATIRVISDIAGEDFPLDFNALMTADYKINFARLLGNILASPRKIPALLAFQKRTISAARKLGPALEQLLGERRRAGR